MKRPVAKYDFLTGELLNVYPSVAEAERDLGKKDAHGNIIKVCTGKIYTAYGYTWKYYTEKEGPKGVNGHEQK